MKFILIFLVSVICLNSCSQTDYNPEFNNQTQKLEEPANLYYPHISKEGWVFVDQDGWKQFDAIFEEACAFHGDVAVVKKNGLYGFIDIKGEIIIDFQFDEARSFNGEYAWVRKNGYEALVDKKGNFFLNNWFVKIENFSDGFAKVVLKNDSVAPDLNDAYIIAYVDKEGKQLAQKWFSGGSSFKDGKANVSISGEYYEMDTEGKIISRNPQNCDNAAPVLLMYDYDFPAIYQKGKRVMQNEINEALVYPEIAKRNGIQGVVQVRFSVNHEGKVGDVSIYESVHPVLDIAAVEAIKKLQNWKPAIKNETNVCSWKVIPVVFQLQ